MERGKLQTLPGCHCVQILEEIIQPQTIFQMLAMPALQSKAFSPKCRNLSLEAKYLHCCKKTKQAVNYFRTKAQWITSVFKCRYRYLSAFMMPLLTLFLTTVLLQTCVVLDILFDIERQNIRELFLCTSSTQPYKCTMSQHAQL